MEQGENSKDPDIYLRSFYSLISIVPRRLKLEPSKTGKSRGLPLVAEATAMSKAKKSRKIRTLEDIPWAVHFTLQQQHTL
jgi:hypothetical protein